MTNGITNQKVIGVDISPHMIPDDDDDDFDVAENLEFQVRLLLLS